MLAHLLVIGDTTEIDDLTDLCLLRSIGKDLCHLLFNGIEVWSYSDGVKEVEGGMDSLECSPHIIKVHGIALDYFDLRAPRQILDLSCITNEDTNIKSISEKGANESTTDIA
ncbi:unannotated protein [freshwater metagenome]|uniref:Unannotated protein n=1 Tax=freshwater metagenome TaxID=449393 RepID=A0A6J6EA31_9ZZZZ